MVMPIRIYGDPLLREKAMPIEDIDDGIRKLAQDMIDTMRAGDGIGLAATQVGRLVRLVVIEGHAVDDDDPEPLAFVNPEIVELSRSRSTFEEGCLSVPDIRSDVERPDALTLRYRTLDGEEITEEANGMYARVIQHEIDHLDGRLFVDHLGAARRNLLRKRLRELQRRSKE
ncbi:MAG: peptide deformylase [Candidatus Eisenbacteria bacterium]